MNFTPILIQNNLLTLVGFQQPTDPQFPLLSTNLTTATSGLTFNDGSIQYLTLENIKDLSLDYSDYAFPEYDTTKTYIATNRIKYTHPTWNSLATYVINQKVILNGISYVSLKNANLNKTPDLNAEYWLQLNYNVSFYDAITNANANLNKQPDINPTFWVYVDIFNLYLEQRVKSSIINVVSKCIQNKNSILEQKKIYYGIGDGSVIVPNVAGEIVGYRFDFIKSDNIKVKINKICYQFTNPVTDLDIYVYNRNTQIATFKITTTDSDPIWVDVSTVEFTPDSGSWFIFYKQDDLISQGAEAIDNNIYITRNLSNFLNINGFSAPETLDKKQVTTNYYTYNTSYFANINFSVLPDLTEWIISNKIIFAEAIKLQFGLDTYKMFAANENIRANRTQRTLDIAEIKANIFTVDAETLKKQYDTEINNVREAIGKAKIDCIVLPEKNGLFNFSTLI